MNNKEVHGQFSTFDKIVSNVKNIFKKRHMYHNICTYIFSSLLTHKNIFISLFITVLQLILLFNTLSGQIFSMLCY